ncbi:hypothetical protein [Mesomycoplasma lagogenitalium]|uniref:Uncharacterized protein n=1 Tax=Mesomycoplasma lagogenitalium TaxID=171286 RepID=A0ABY8LU26_9BACT|nr:hypothetical protein [Mesomycoplasma lagogenitalium]WGI36745.1 hypothetical protein QEG99_00445 [Mesomycoplasma lagogenitalium]
MKYKPKIERRIFYLLITLLSISIIFLLFWLLEGLIIGTQAFDNLKDQERESAINTFLTVRYVGYITNSVVIIGYLINIIISKKYGYGYLFCFIWILFFIGIIIAPYFTSGNINENIIRLMIVIFWTIIFSILAIINCYLLIDLKRKRLMHHYKKLRISKGG